jgi:cytoskeletal protein RodZ
MDDQFRKSELRHQARIRLGAQRERVRTLRRRAIVASVLAFVLLWCVVFTQLVSGNDPVLGGKPAKAVASTRSATGQRAATEEAPVELTPTEAEPESAEAEPESGLTEEAETLEIEAAEAEAVELEAAEVEAVEAELAAAAEEEAEAVTTSPS